MIAFLYVTFFIVAALSLVGTGAAEVAYRRKYSLSRSKVLPLSWPSRQILALHNTIPSENLPYGNIYNMLLALDAKHAGWAITEHFSRRSYDGRVYNMNRCPSTRCEFVEYHFLYNELTSIQEALAEQAHKLKIAGLAGTLTEVEEFTQRLREERDLINSVTKQLTTD